MQIPISEDGSILLPARFMKHLGIPKGGELSYAMQATGKIHRMDA
jgi:hypothetical protein